MGDFGRASFDSALPIWIDGLEKEMNVLAGFRAVVRRGSGDGLKLRIAASSVYRCYADGAFLGHGPAASPHGYYRIDEWTLPASDGIDTIVAIEVAGYNVNSFYTLDQPSFLQAEIAAEDGSVAAWTGGEGEAGFERGLLTEKIRKTQRYSFQRAFTEAYRLRPGYGEWRSQAGAPIGERAAWRLQPEKATIARAVAYPRFGVVRPVLHVSNGNVRRTGPLERYRKDRSLTGVGPLYLGYPEEELETVPSLFLQETEIAESATTNAAYEPEEAFHLGENGYRILDFGSNQAGFIGFSIDCLAASKLYVVYDEVLNDGDIDFLRLDAVNAIAYELEPGRYEVEALEPSALRYAKFLALEGEVSIGGVYVREYVGSDVGNATFSSGVPEIDAIFAAGIETYRHNAVDVFMDCPSRERAGWLCDSFFLARTAFDVSGHAGAERFFFENYALPHKFGHIPEGMVPMCYPADHFDGNFIPNWGMWFVLQLEEYVARSGDREMADALREKVLALLRYFDGFLNEDGLLESLDGWLFVEFTQANDWVQDVNYPTNMLYAGMLDAAARLYGDEERSEQAAKVRAEIRKQAFDGRFFADHAVRENGELVVRRDHVSEACQYYAFVYRVAAPANDEVLWRTLLEQFGPHREGDSDAYPAIPRTNQVIGNFLRMETLSLGGAAERMLAEWPAYFGHMAEGTGTLWEHNGPFASCDHGFTSHVVRMAYRDFLGVRELDPVGRRLKLRPGAVSLNACSGTIPAGEATISVAWSVEDGELKLSLDIPADYTVEIENASGLPIQSITTSKA